MREAAGLTVIEFCCIAGISQTEYRALTRGAGDPERDEAWLRVEDWAAAQVAYFLALQAELRRATERARQRRITRTVAMREW